MNLKYDPFQMSSPTYCILFGYSLVRTTKQYKQPISALRLTWLTNFFDTNFHFEKFWDLTSAKQGILQNEIRPANSICKLTFSKLNITVTCLFQVNRQQCLGWKCSKCSRRGNHHIRSRCGRCKRGRTKSRLLGWFKLCYSCLSL